MSLIVKCKCGKKLSVKPESAGKKGKCPACGALFTIPAGANPESPSLKEALDIPFASASANPGNHAYWNELQESGSSTASNSRFQGESGLGLVSVALILPIISGVILCFVKSFPIALGISAAIVFTTAVLVALDARRLGEVDLNGRKRENAGLIFVGMLAMWIVFYPLAFFRRSAFIAPNLGFLALLVALFFVSAPFVSSMLMPVQLPSCNSPEVAQLLEQVIRSTPVGAATKSIDGHREVSYDSTTNIRHGECVAHTDNAVIPVKFFVEWQDKKKGLFQVRLPDPELPSCNSREVAQVLEQAIRSTPVGAATKSIDGYRELSYDSTANIRYGECVVHTDAGDIPVKYIVEWQDKTKGLFQVRILASPD